MEKIVMAKPMLVTSVIMLPRRSGRANRETKVENCGESPTTVIPQISIKIEKIGNEKLTKKGKTKQQIPEVKS